MTGYPSAGSAEAKPKPEGCTDLVEASEMAFLLVKSVLCFFFFYV
jgi:hypothetical protein